MTTKLINIESLVETIECTSDEFESGSDLTTVNRYRVVNTKETFSCHYREYKCLFLN